MTDKTFLADLFIMLEQNRIDEMRTLLREKLGTWEFHELNPDRVVVTRAPQDLPRAAYEAARDVSRMRFPVEDWQYEVSNEDTRLGYEEWLDHQMEAEAEDEALRRVECQEVTRPQPIIRCTGCGNEIDPDMCHCGGSYADHNDMEQGHRFVPVGCDCGRVKEADGILPIIQVANDAYGDNLVLDYYKNPDGNFGDTLAKFIASEIKDVSDDHHSKAKRFKMADRAMRRAAVQIRHTAYVLWQAGLAARREEREKGEAATCPGQELPPKS